MPSVSAPLPSPTSDGQGGPPSSPSSSSTATTRRPTSTDGTWPGSATETASRWWSRQTTAWSHWRGAWRPPSPGSPASSQSDSERRRLRRPNENDLPELAGGGEGLVGVSGAVHGIRGVHGHPDPSRGEVGQHMRLDRRRHRRLAEKRAGPQR